MELVKVTLTTSSLASFPGRIFLLPEETIVGNLHALHIPAKDMLLFVRGLGKTSGTCYRVLEVMSTFIIKEGYYPELAEEYSAEVIVQVEALYTTLDQEEI